MSKFKVTISEETAEEWGKSWMAIADDNEKHERSALYFLTSGALCSYNIINMGEAIQATGKYPQDINSFCIINLLFIQIDKVKTNPQWMSELKEKECEINKLYDIMLKSMELFDKFDKDIRYIEPNVKLQKHILNQYVDLIEYILDKENIRDTFQSTDKHNHDALVRFHMDLGKYTKKVIDFFLSYFIYKERTEAA